MKLSTKGRYAVTALADMALNGAGGGEAGAPLTSLSQIAERQKISLPYLEQLFSRLRRAKLVVSARGPGGGYRLARPSSEIRIIEIMTAVDETLKATKCNDEIGDVCGQDRAACLTHDLWEQLSAHVYLFLHNVTLADVVAKKLNPCNATSNFLALLDEEGIDAAAPAGGGAALRG